MSKILFLSNPSFKEPIKNPLKSSHIQQKYPNIHRHTYRLVLNGSLLTISSTFHSLFKVLFFFRSHYLFAIGFSSIFSVTWDLPRILGCNPKQPDSKKQNYMVTLKAGWSHERGCHPLWRVIPNNLDPSKCL